MESLTFGLMRLTDADLFFQWMADKEGVKYARNIFQTAASLQDVEQWLVERLHDKAAFYRSLIRRDTDKTIGYIGLSQVDRYNNSAELEVLIGDRDSRSKGFGSEAIAWLMGSGFHIGLHRIWVRVAVPNLGAINLFKRLGFVEEGRLRQSCYRDEAYYDELIMSVLQTEWQHPEPQE